MEFLATLSRQPLFRLLGAIIVLILVELRPVVGVGAAVLWILWVWVGNSASKSKGW